MKSVMKPIILPLDGFSDSSSLESSLRTILSEESARKLIGFIKINDALHLRDISGPQLVSNLMAIIEECGSDASIFLDIKIADTSGTIANTLKHYADCSPGILTVRASVSAQGFVAIRKTLPDTKIALVSALTDMTLEECLRRHNHSPAEKIFTDAQKVQHEYSRVKSDGMADTAVDMVVCSPLELPSLTENLDGQYEFIVPGIRDKWMLKGQQARTAGVRAALDTGATLVVMGSQMTKGNPNGPDGGTSAEESRRLTAIEISKANPTE